MATSYISEHSAEFALVPALKKILESKFEFVVPLFPWANRETSNISKLLHKNDDFFVLAMFPRRPKISEHAEKSIHITMNYELDDLKKLGEEHGILVIAGCPQASYFWELAKSKHHIWLSIGHNMTKDYLTPVEHLRNTEDSPILTNGSILELVNTVCKKQNITSFEAFIKESRWTLPRGLFCARYNPVYFLLRNKPLTI